MNRKYYQLGLCILFSLFFWVSQADAQFKLGADIGAGIPIGNLSDFTETGFGFKLKGRYFVSDNLGLGLDIGQHSFDYQNIDATYRLVPVTLNVDYYFSGGPLRPMIGAGLGVYFESVKSDNISVDGDNEVGLNLGGGLAYEVGSNVDLTLEGKFNLIEDATFFALTFGILIGL